MNRALRFTPLGLAVVIVLFAVTWITLPADGSVSANAGRIAFVRFDPDLLAIYLINADGSGVRRVTPRGWAAVDPTWSPDGRKIAFVRRHPDARDRPDPRDALYVVRADGGGLIRLTRNGVADDSPTWSPNGKMIAFTSHLGGGNTDIFAVNADGSRLRQLTNTGGLGSEESPSWSPDGRRIVFVYGKYPDRPDIWVMDASGKNRRRLTQADPGADGEFGRPQWSPDGREIAFVRTLRPGPWAIHVIRPDGSGLRQLTTPVSADSPAWSPNGRWIGFSSLNNDTLDYDLYRINADGSGLRRLAPNADEFSWSPDARKVVFMRDEDDLYLINAGGSGIKRLTRDQAPFRGGHRSAFDPTWQPKP